MMTHSNPLSSFFVIPAKAGSQLNTFIPFGSSSSEARDSLEVENRVALRSRVSTSLDTNGAKYDR